MIARTAPIDDSRTEIPVADRREDTGTHALRVRGLTVRYGDREPAVRDIHLDVAPGEIVALLGESGSGKSSIVNAVLGLLPEGGSAETDELAFGPLRVDPRDRRQMRAIRGHRVGLIPQDCTVALDPVLRVGPQILEGVAEARRFSRAQRRARVAELLNRVGFADPEAIARRYPHELSGGMAQRVLIAVALAARPTLLIADEPAAALDTITQARVMDWITDLAEHDHIGVLMVTHDLALAAQRAHRGVLLERGTIVARGDIRSIAPGTRPARTRQAAPVEVESATDPIVTAADPVVPEQAGVVPAWAGVVPEQAGVVPEQAGVLPARAAVEPRRSVVESEQDPAGWRQGAAGPDDPADLLRLDTVRRLYPSVHGLTGVREVSLALAPGAAVGLVGGSGAGKTTVARLLAGLEAPDDGVVRYRGVDVRRLERVPRRRFRRAVQLIAQNPFSSIDPRYSARRAIEEPLRAFGIGDRATRRDRVRELADRVRLPESVLGNKSEQLSGGQCQRVAIARALATDPDVLICDEAVSALDSSTKRRIIELLGELRSELGLTIVFITHDLSAAADLTDRLVVMLDGRIIESGATATLLSAPSHEYTRDLVAATPAPIQISDYDQE
ncbi:ABC transporter ATP-binding protein [Nocardia vinacea]|uniref:ABC transporter ATP-binding protein n=1 Tax=Nocardia vinacea TaxID=96468 RepID=A0ABZ1YXA8_9NOCA|nr:ABC transporter ATP-binding protein [Nocardia vinacea]